MNGTRDAGIDCARGLAMMLVVLGHSPAFASLSPQSVAWIFTFHVAAFFFISGTLLRPDRFSAGHSARRILMPFVIVGVLLAAIKCVLRNEDPVLAALGLIWGTGATLPSSQLWFLPVLFLTLLASVVIARRGFRPDRPLIALAVLATLLGLASLALRLPAPDLAEPLRRPGVAGPLGWIFGLDLLPLATFFALFGYWAASAGLLLRLRGWMVLPAFAVVTVCFLMGARTDMNMRLIHDFSLAILAGLSGCLGMWSLGRAATRVSLLSRVVSMIGQHSMMILAFHVLVQNAAVSVVTQVAGAQTAGLAVATVVGFVAGLVLPLALSIGIDLAAARWRRPAAVGGA